MGSKSNLQIYIVEDDKMYLRLLSHNLNAWGYTNHKTFASGESFLLAIEKKPDMVLLDHQLGMMCGIEVLNNIRMIHPNAHVVFLSGQEEVSVASEAIKNGAKEYIEKNADAMILLRQHLDEYYMHCDKSVLYRIRAWFS